MKRSFLEDLGLTKDVIDKIIDENGSDIENAKSAAAKKFDSERETLQGQIEDLKTQVTQRDADLSDIQKQLTAANENADKLAEAQKSLSSLQKKYETETKAWEAKNAQQAYEFAVREKANTLKFSSEAAKREFIRDAIAKDFKMEQNNLLGFDDYVNIYKESDPGAFAVEKEPEPPKADPEPAPEPEPPKKQPNIVLPGNSGIQGGAKSLTEMMKAKNANPDLVVNFNK
ncbi:MAG: phage scaffolding protein [Lachnospiraceae bacterium]|nr:phage scaffolding protein [Lachnospiraceae bacterium]